jgi:hypothetical protein
MKKIHTLGLEKILLFCGFSLALTLAGFWQYQHNVGEAEKLSRVQSGVGTCFARVTQSFTAAMIRENTSPYLKRDFMALSDECLTEGTKASGIDIATFPKAGKLFNDLVSEVYWFHEKVVKVLAITAGNVNAQPPLTAITEKYSKVEELKLDLQDQLDVILGQYREARMRDEVLVGFAFLLFMISLGMLGAKELALLRHKRQVESQALTLLNAGHSQVGAMVDQMVQKALKGQGMPIAGQVFADYHAGVLEHLATRFNGQAINVDAAPMAVPEIKTKPQVMEANKTTEQEVDARKLLTSQAVRLKAQLEVQEGQITADPEVLAQLIQAMGQRFAGGELVIKGVRENDFYRISVCVTGQCFNAAELNYVTRPEADMDGVNVNVVIAADLLRESDVRSQIQNVATPDGGPIVGAEASFIFPVNNARSLVNVVKGKKKDLAKSLAPSLFN